MYISRKYVYGWCYINYIVYLSYDLFGIYSPSRNLRLILTFLRLTFVMGLAPEYMQKKLFHGITVNDKLIMI